jgi:hypothetical protein
VKAWIANEQNEFYCVVIFAETREKARYKALQYTECFEDAGYKDIRCTRIPVADKMYNGRDYMDWCDPDDRLFLVKECGFECDYVFDGMGIEGCEKCSAKEFCDIYKNFIKEMENK